MDRYRGKTALVTGASSGIGEAFARELAAQGAGLILVARSAGRLEEIAEELRARHGAEVAVIPADLGEPQAAERIRQEVERRGLRVDTLVNNAGFGTHGRFEELTAEREHQEIAVNVAALVDLTHAFAPGMLARGSGEIVNVASTVAFQPTPYMAVYGATKAFVTSFSAALAEEYRGRGVRVLAICPGATETGFFDVVGGDSVALGAKRTPAQVVATALRALEQGRSVAIDGPANAVMSVVAKRLPFALGARIAAFITRPRAARSALRSQG